MCSRGLEGANAERDVLPTDSVGVVGQCLCKSLTDLKLIFFSFFTTEKGIFLVSCKRKLLPFVERSYCCSLRSKRYFFPQCPR